MKRFLYIIGSVIFIVFVVLFLFNHCQNGRKYNKERTEIFDECMTVYYPALQNFSNASVINASVLIECANIAYRDNPNDFDAYKEELNKLYDYYLHESGNGGYVNYWLNFNKIYIGGLSDIIFKAPDSRKNELEAFNEIYQACLLPRGCDLELSYDNFIKLCNETKANAAKGITSLSKYNNPNIDVTYWKRSDIIESIYRKTSKIDEEYKSKKYWPFTFLSKDEK